MYKVKIYGPITAQYEQLKNRIIMASHQTGCSIVFEEIQEISRILSDRIASVPAAVCITPKMAIWTIETPIETIIKQLNTGPIALPSVQAKLSSS